MVTNEPLHTDTSNHPANLTAAEYLALHRDRALEIGDAGLHVPPQEFIDAIVRAHGADR